MFRSTELRVTNFRIERVGKGISNPFEAKFGPLIEDINDKKRELERRVGVANDECLL